METIRSSEEINRMGTEQNEKQGMALSCDGNSPSVLGGDRDQGSIAGFRKVDWGKTDLALSFHGILHFALH